MELRKFSLCQVVGGLELGRVGSLGSFLSHVVRWSAVGYNIHDTQRKSKEKRHTKRILEVFWFPVPVVREA